MELTIPQETEYGGSVLAAGASCTLNVTFMPKAATPPNRVLKIRDGDLTGRGDRDSDWSGEPAAVGGFARWTYSLLSPSSAATL
jgi:hypothetical protein